MMPTTDPGPQLSAWTCPVGDGCTGRCAITHKRNLTRWHGSPEDVAIANAAEHDAGRVHVFVDGRYQTFKVWRAAGRIQSREVL